MVLNSQKTPLLVIHKDIVNESIELDKTNLHAEAEQKLLGIIIDKDFNFQSHIKSIMKTANQNLSVLIKVALLMADFNQKRLYLTPLLKDSSIIVPYSGCLVLEL